MILFILKVLKWGLMSIKWIIYKNIKIIFDLTGNNWSKYGFIITIINKLQKSRDYNNMKE